jgi:hypothetical protein
MYNIFVLNKIRIFSKSNRLKFKDSKGFGYGNRTAIHYYQIIIYEIIRIWLSKQLSTLGVYYYHSIKINFHQQNIFIEI